MTVGDGLQRGLAFATGFVSGIVGVLERGIRIRYGVRSHDGGRVVCFRRGGRSHGDIGLLASGRIFVATGLIST